MLNYINTLKNKKLHSIAFDPYFLKFYQLAKKLRSLCMQDQTFVI
jgi:hypothetical protein